MAQPFVVGDIVKIKSGGPDMTVEKYMPSYESYRCQWFAGKKLEKGDFPEDSLKKVEKPES